MALMKTWYTPDEVEDKFGVKKSVLLGWVESGLVRAEQEGKKILQVNIDDVKLEMENLVSR
ncbi:MAG: MerR family transcriptional regulator [Desulfuromonadaceae bacterium]